jgi:hypothetical protein
MDMGGDNNDDGAEDDEGEQGDEDEDGDEGEEEEDWDEGEVGRGRRLRFWLQDSLTFGWVLAGSQLREEDSRAHEPESRGQLR